MMGNVGFHMEDPPLPKYIIMVALNEMAVIWKFRLFYNNHPIAVKKFFNLTAMWNPGVLQKWASSAIDFNFMRGISSKPN